MINKKFVSPALMWAVVIAGIILIFLFAPAGRFWRENSLISIITITAIVYWLYFFSRAAYVNRGLALSAAKTKRLVTGGVYGLVRHPIYSADIILAWGIFLFWPTVKVFLGVVWLSAVLFFWMRLEEKALIEKFGDQYRTYKKTVPMFLPKLFKN